MADKNKQLVLVVEGTAAMASHWRTIVSDYLPKLIRSFCGYEATKEADNPDVELALVVFNARESYDHCLTRQSKWTRNMDLFYEWLSDLHFSGGDFCDPAIAEGLAEVTSLFPSINEIQNGHCILVAASNPYPLSTPVYPPSDKSEGGLESRLADAETVAISFSEFSISLSVICPRKLPKLEAIYNAGKRNPSAADHTINIVKNPHYLVLLSEDFIVACADLSQSGITILPSNPIPVTVSLPPSTLTFVSSATFQDDSRLQTTAPFSTSQEIISNNDKLQTSAPFSTSQEIISNNGKLQDLKPVVSVPTSALILNKLAQASLMNPTGLSSSVPTSQRVTPSEKLSVASIAESTILAGSGQVAQQLVHNETSMNQNMMPPPPPRMSHELVQSKSSHSTYAKVWEGDLSCQRGDQHVFISRLEGYQSSTASKSIAEDWPPAMLIHRLISKDYMTNNQHVDEADLLVFRSMDHHHLHGYVQKKKLCMVILLPSQTLLVAVSNKPCRLIGMLFPMDMVFQPQISKKKQRASQ